METTQPAQPAQTTTPALPAEQEIINKELVKYTLEEETKIRLREIFTPILEQVSGWRDKALALVITDATQLTEMQQAREGRLILKDLRCEAERLRKTLKEDSLQKGRAIDGIANLVKGIIEPIEDHLQAQEDYAKIKEAERRSALKIARVNILTPLGVTVEFYNLEDMSEEAFNGLVAQSQRQILEKQEAARKAVEEQAAREQAERAEQERQRLENERLKKEAEELEAKRKAEAEEARKREQELADQLRKQREEEARKLAEIEARAKAEREEAARIKAEEDKKLAEARELVRLQEEDKRKAEHLAKQKEQIAKQEADIQAKRIKELEDRAKAQEAERQRLAKLEEERIEKEKQERREKAIAEEQAELDRLANEAEGRLNEVAGLVKDETLARNIAPDLFAEDAIGSDAYLLKKYVGAINRVAMLESPDNKLQSQEAKDVLKSFRVYLKNSLESLATRANNLNG